MASTGKAVLAHFGAYRPDQIDKALCLSYAAVRADQGIKPGSIHTELGHLRSALKFGVDVRMIDRAPRVWIPPKPAPKERYLDRTEIVRLLDAAHAAHIALAMHLLLATGARVGAVLDLTWDRVDLDRGQINYRLDDAVTRKGRAVVPVNAGLRAALSTAREAALSDHVVEYAGGRVASIRKGFANACDRAGLDGVTIHTLRHTAAVHMAEAGIPMPKIAQMLGHSNTATTERVYARYAPDHMQDAADVLDFVKIRGVK
jgi:integrase